MKYGNRGKCDHAIKIPGANYEIGVVKDQSGDYELQVDFYDSSLSKRIGNKAGILKQAYRFAKVKVAARQNGKGYSNAKDIQNRAGWKKILVYA